MPFDRFACLWQASKARRSDSTRLVYEVKPRAVNKGTAIARLTEKRPFARRMPVYIGDDHTDEYAFREVLARGGIAVQVGPTLAPPGCLWIESPGETRRWLAELL